MLRSTGIRRTVLACGLAAALLAPLPARADAGEPSTGGSKQGVVMAVLCGAGINISRTTPIPIVVTVTAVACMGMLMDAMLTPDPL